jgi:hypothetical protein
MILRIKQKETLIAATVLFLGFFLFSIYGLVRHLLGGTVFGLNNDCRCSCPPFCWAGWK